MRGPSCGLQKPGPTLGRTAPPHSANRTSKARKRNKRRGGELRPEKEADTRGDLALVVSLAMVSREINEGNIWIVALHHGLPGRILHLKDKLSILGCAAVRAHYSIKGDPRSMTSVSRNGEDKLRATIDKG